LVRDNIKEDIVQLIAVDIGIYISYFLDSALDYYIDLGEIIEYNQDI